MRKLLVFFAGAVLFFILSSCSESNSPEKKKNEEASINNPADVLDKTLSTASSIKCLSVDMNIEQQMSGASFEKPVELFSEITTDLFAEPVAFHQNTTMKMKGSKRTIKTEAYLTEEGLYFNDGSQKSWTKYSAGQARDLSGPANRQLNPAGELKQIKGIEKALKLHEKQNHYILTLDSLNEDYSEIVKEVVIASLPPNLQGDSELIKSLDVKKLNYEISINKESFYPSSLKISVEMDIEKTGQPVQVIQTLESTYSNFNSLQGISVPDSIRQNAKLAEPVIKK